MKGMELERIVATVGSRLLKAHRFLAEVHGRLQENSRFIGHLAGRIAPRIAEDRSVLEALQKRLLADDAFTAAVAAEASERMGNKEYIIFSYRDVYTGEQDAALPPQDSLAEEICAGLGKKPGRITLERFLDGSSVFTVEENVRRKDVYVIFSPRQGYDVDGELFRLMGLTKTLKSAHGGNITAVIPCLPYSRQDQSYGKRQLVTARFVADMLQQSGVDHLITVGLHAPQIEGFYKSIDHLKTRLVFSHYLQEVARERLMRAVHVEATADMQGVGFFQQYVTLISTDAGGMKGVNELRRDMDPTRKIDVGFTQKERVAINLQESGKVVGDVAGKVVVLYDDILDTGGSLFGAAKAAKEAGAVYVLACVDHALGNSKPGELPFEEKIARSDIDELVVTNTLPDFYERVRQDSRLSAKTTVLSVAPLLREAIIRDQKGYTIREIVRHVGKENLYRVVHQKAA